MNSIEEIISIVTMEAYPSPPPHIINPEKLSCERRKYITRESMRRYALQFSDDDRIHDEVFSFSDKNRCMNGDDYCGLKLKS